MNWFTDDWHPAGYSVCRDCSFGCDMALDDTLTDEEFQRALQDSNEDWLAQQGRADPDLRVEGLGASLLTKLLGLFGGGSGG